MERADEQQRPFAPRRGFRELLEEEDVLGVLAGGEFEVLAEFVEDEQQPARALGRGFGEQRRRTWRRTARRSARGPAPAADRREAGGGERAGDGRDQRGGLRLEQQGVSGAARFGKRSPRSRSASGCSGALRASRSARKRRNEDLPEP